MSRFLLQSKDDVQILTLKFSPGCASEFSPVRNPTAQIQGLILEFKHQWSVCSHRMHIHEAAALCFGDLIGGKGTAVNATIGEAVHVTSHIM